MDATKLEAFRALVEAEQHTRLIDEGFNPEWHRHDCRIKVGRKYANIDVGDSGKYMVDLATDEIFGIKGYGVIHRGHRYGTLDPIQSFDWSGYRAVPRKQAA